ncbi:MAG: LLM class flavin-dependent oxidoreductase [Dehalococcoidia bacterium]|jgi:alkanesulfonate monooxygenase SsuD/methylene tetrahydromethanopterin reductase-like flavin-dependent oxidoreductase (luciferase family)
MKIGVLQFFSWSRRIPLETVYQRAFERIAIMDEGGYDGVWLAEHHFNTYSVCPSPHLMAMNVAARTKNLRIGLAVSLAVFYNPLRLAEEVALLDVLSGGRINWGAGRGFDRGEFGAFKIDVAESAARFQEAVDIVLAAWTNEKLTYHGQFWDYEDVEVLPKPMQKPHPPTWLAATSPGAINRAASRGHTILMDPHASHEEIREKRALYQRVLEENGYSIEGRDIPMARLIAIAPTEEQAKQVAYEGARWTVGSYAKGMHEDPIERYVNQVMVYGTAESVTEKLLALKQDLPINYLLAAPLSHESFVLFTEKVLPKLV